MDAVFQSILSRKANEIEKPVPPPVGHYLATNPKVPEVRKIGKNETPALEFTLTLLAPQDDVDESDFAAYGGMEKLKGKTVRWTLWLSDDALYRSTQQLINAFGFDDSMELGEMVSASVGQQLIVEIGHRPSPDGNDIFADVKSAAKA